MQRFKDIMMLRFLIQAGFSASVLALCIFMLATDRADTDKEQALYWSGLTGTVANWLPSPQFPEELKPKTKRRTSKPKPRAKPDDSDK